MSAFPSRRTLIFAAVAATFLIGTVPQPSFAATPTHGAFAYGPVAKIATYGTGTSPVRAQKDAESACHQRGGGSDCQPVGWWKYGQASLALNKSTGKWGWGTSSVLAMATRSPLTTAMATTPSILISWQVAWHRKTSK